MHITRKLEDGRKVVIRVRPDMEIRLKGKCFRGLYERKAGNFLNWRSASEVFRDPHILREFLRDVVDALVAGTQMNRVEILHHSNVGWSSTMPGTPRKPDYVEPFHPTRRSYAWRVKLDRTDILAPRTDLATIVYELKREDGRLVAIVQSIYPGPDVGEIEGNVSYRERVVFFDFSHPGAA